MKKILMLMFCAFALLLPSCGPPRHYSNQKADDAISEAVYQELGGEQLYYQGKWLSGDNVIGYSYLIEEEQEGQLGRLIEAVNKAIQQEGIEDRISIACEKEIPGGVECILEICNYSEGESVTVGNISLCNMGVSGFSFGESIYNNPATYRDLPGIVYLRVGGEVAKTSEKEGTDWYAYFPELEKLEVVLPEQ